MDRKNSYFSGVKSEEVPQKIARASPIRECLQLGDSRDLTEDLLPLMCVEFACLNQLTVNPFPIKYMREFLNIFPGEAEIE